MKLIFSMQKLSAGSYAHALPYRVGGVGLKAMTSQEQRTQLSLRSWLQTSAKKEPRLFGEIPDSEPETGNRDGTGASGSGRKHESAKGGLHIQCSSKVCNLERWGRVVLQSTNPALSMRPKSTATVMLMAPPVCTL